MRISTEHSWILPAMLLALALAGCSGPGTDPKVDDDTPVCGDGVVEGGEVCDGDDLAGSTCGDFGADGGSLSCAPGCGTYDTSQCAAPESCGNGELDGQERCDGASLGDATCASLGLGDGELACRENCLDFDRSECGGSPDCGNGELDSDELCDGDRLGGMTCEGLDLGTGDLGCASNCQSFETSSCSEACVPDCGGRECGTDPVCGTSCGSCEDGMCNAMGVCELTPRTRFDSSAVNWTVPQGGENERGFHALGGSAGALGGDGWTTTDLTGDGLPDLVVTAVGVELPGYNWAHQVPGYGSDPHWNVYENSGSGFAADPTTWSVPEGGEDERGFHALGGSAGALGGDGWTTTDVTGDGRPDLVVTAVGVELPGYNWAHRVPGYGSSPHWKVYENTGSGFADDPTTWSVPEGGEDERGFHALGGSAGALGGDGWTTTDLTGDGRPDLVVTAVGVELPGYNWAHQVLGYGSNPHWKVYENTGSGFAGSPSDWTVPDGGEDERGFHTLSGSAGALGGDGWTTTDLTGDGRPDLVVTAAGVELPGYNWAHQVLGYGSNPHWKVYENTGSGFAGSPSDWTVPDGGEDQRGFHTLSGSAGALGGDGWTTTDLTGDGRPDLVVAAVGVELPGYNWAHQVLGYDSDPHWKIYENTGSGFAGSPTDWAVPQGGEDARGFHALSGSAGALGGQGWATVDLTGDGALDLVVTAVGVELPGYNWAHQVQGYGSGPYWTVYPAVP